MSMTKVIEIDGKQVAFKASAAIPRIYRVRYGRDKLAGGLIKGITIELNGDSTQRPM